MNQKHLYPLLEKLSFEKGGMHGFRHHRVSTLVMAGVSKDVIKDQIGHGSEQMIKRYTHLRPEFIQNELDRVRNFVLIDPFASGIAQNRPVRVTSKPANGEGSGH